LDFNYLYHRQQVSLMRADRAANGAARAAHEGLARLYDARIAHGKSERHARLAAPAVGGSTR
jgi:hypothetical protein